MEDKLKAVIIALNSISVKGEHDMDKMLGSIQMIKSVISELEAEVEKNG